MGNQKPRSMTAGGRSKMMKEMSGFSEWRILVLLLGNKHVHIGFAPHCVL